MRIFKWLSLFLFIVCISCDKPLPELEGLDTRRWQEDKNGCNNFRVTMREVIDREKEKLLGLDQIQIVKILGRPDQNELTTRNQKFFYYFLEPGPACKASDSAAARLSIRFNAVGLAKEVAVE
jgi:hypothetical protein